MQIIEAHGTRFVVEGFEVHQIASIVPAHAHRCYELSALRVGFGPEQEYPFTGYDGATLVHGTIKGPESPAIGHAWVIEPDGEGVWEPASDTVYPAKVFAALFAAEEIVSYDVSEARRWMQQTEHYGPWEDEASIPA